MKKIALIILFVALTTACIEKTDTPEQVAEKYWQAIKAGDNEAAKKLVSKTSQQNFNEYLALDKERKIIIETVELGETKSSVSTTIHSEDSTPDNHQHKLETMLVLEDGHWKIDASRTQIPILHITDETLDELTKKLSDSMQENINTMDHTINEGMEMLNEAMKEGSKEMGQSLLKLMDDLNKSMQDSVDRMKQRRQKNIQNPDTNQGEGMI